VKIISKNPEYLPIESRETIEAQVEREERRESANNLDYNPILAAFQKALKK
jgi:hypothetical protein